MTRLQANQTIDQVYAAAARPVQSLLRRAGDTNLSEDYWDAVQDALESLPLATADYATATKRVANARDYVATGEIGAAKYELRMLLRAVQMQQGTVSFGKSA